MKFLSCSDTRYLNTKAEARLNALLSNAAASDIHPAITAVNAAAAIIAVALSMHLAAVEQMHVAAMPAAMMPNVILMRFLLNLNRNGILLNSSSRTKLKISSLSKLIICSPWFSDPDDQAFSVVSSTLY